jgi:poly(A) polymerase
VLEELYRLLRGGAARRSMELLAETGVADSLSPHLARLFGSRSDDELDIVTRELPAPEDDSEDWGSVWKDETSDDDIAPDEESIVPRASESEDQDGRMELAWNLLGQIDRMFAEDRPTTNALVLAAAVAAFVVPDLLDESLRPAEASDMVDEVLQPLIKEIGIARRDAERTNQILLAQRRLVPSKKRRTKPMAFVKRDYFDEALTLYELLAAARGEVASELSFWRKLQVEGGAEPNAQTQRKRRRGGRRRRRE